MKIKSILVALSAVMTLCVTACSSNCDKPLVDTQWHLVELNSQTVALPDDTFNLIFSKDLSIGGVAACNRLLGNYSVSENNSLKFATIGTTMMLCPEFGELENVFTVSLGSVAGYKISGDTLTLSDGNGKTVAIFTALAPEK
ncbi:MAG: META domain-containing protein [Alistipes sp.]|nr:META domain-containing protein [Alistipes sp.]